MYWLAGHIKRNPQLRWHLPDRIFFGRGACHILAGTYLKTAPLPGFHAEMIQPAAGFSGSHIFVTDGHIAFDFHGYSIRDRLLVQHWRGWRARYPDWHGTVTSVTFDLLDTRALNTRKFLGPAQYYGNVKTRAGAYLTKIDHIANYTRAAQLN
ncbi:hypothetical protein [Shimia abyssi]|uniref:Uncharacterized protein n=1 Tax=Shimia abyssi TaxID=1662395 RepID=A0A2P8F634_9RHOB|nr:hypothetical protein [Shimia abyssi]PSL17169.1 hypothetical protein CLV88_12021 [Shimia abyssi]